MAKSKAKSKAEKQEVDPQVLSLVGGWASRAKHKYSGETARLLRQLQSITRQAEQALLAEQAKAEKAKQQNP